MTSLQPSPAPHPIAMPTSGGAAPLFAFGRSDHDDASRIWLLAFMGGLFAFTAASLTCLWPRWYSASLLSLAWQSSKLVFLAAATGAVVVRTVWGALNHPPAVNPTRIALNLSASWVFLPCMVLLYEANTLWMLAVAAVVSAAMALGLRLLMPASADTAPREHLPVSALATFDGLPPADSPLLTAFWIAILIQAALLLAAGDKLLLASFPLCVGVFMLIWRWSAATPRSAEIWLGAHRPLWPATAALILTALCIIPFSVGHSGGRFRIRPIAGPHRIARQEVAEDGYVGIILYPPPVKKQIVAPLPRPDSFHTGARVKPQFIRFDGAYWYFKAPSDRPSPLAHIAHGKPTDVNVRSTDFDPLIMEAHQNLGLPVDLASLSEIDLAITNADIRPGQIDLAILLSDTTMPGKRAQLLGRQPIVSSELRQIPLNRPHVQETLRFHIPSSRTLRRFDQITVVFLTSAMRARAGSRVSIDSFELLPKP